MVHAARVSYLKCADQISSFVSSQRRAECLVPGTVGGMCRGAQENLCGRAELSEPRELGQCPSGWTGASVGYEDSGRRYRRVSRSCGETFYPPLEGHSHPTPASIKELLVH